MQVLISGGAGFLGRHIIAVAEAAGHTVHAPRSRQFDLETYAGVEEYLSELRQHVGPMDVFIHSAAHYGGIGILQAEPATVLDRNTRMAVNAFRAAREFGIRKVIPIGSACAYPGYSAGDLVESEFWNGPLHDSVEAYGFTKKLLLVAQKANYKQHGIQSNHLVLTNLYGPHDVFTEHRSHVVAALIKKVTDADQEVVLWGDGSPVREFLYVKDAADAVVRAIALEHDPEPINIGTGVGTSIRELAEAIARHTGFAGAIRWDTSKPNGAARKVLNVQRMKEKLAWQPRYDLETGLAETIGWYVQNKQEADARQ